ncbi:helix-turn-helix domain-containing protein [Pseudorhodobacter sp.]|uniref:helix-turn-helix domain-containing protein n=1 Tax=Pseudorhodobacter sp. TaxID=1934400 RepID=UPI002648DCA5|nr:helix-turn-helix transcriptional regulator [Pseudorhodobacter sp.]MDN5787117.1 helix-turn-helix transcriptional regulator [Pseudorhodobacter sp.]
MADSEQTSEVVRRLHSLRVQRGYTIQQMAQVCSIPKSSLESYMRFEGARKPGLDALLSIANGMDVSLDWLVGRSVYSFPATVTEKDYALACFSVVSDLINWLCKEQKKQTTPIVGDATIAGITDAEVAAKSMLLFVERVELFRNNQGDVGLSRRDLHYRFDRLLSNADSVKK